MWVIVVCAFVVGIVIGILVFFTHFYNNKDLGKKFFEESEKPFGKAAPSMYYHKQRMFRLCYGFFIGIHYLLVVMSISFTSLTIYMVMDDGLDLYIRIIISVMAAITTTLQTILRFDKVGEGYICAMRIIEQAILEYENRKESELDVLLDANLRAEEVIHNMYH
ncbi:hypothetical protein HGO97_009340 [Faecalicatena sp. AGMB00832]|uniref:Uncharacterized protein n=1 Tax=Faecalicatena faecalis TaxID=2726362 RepID=A0ABS6D350_9FIRM|nr:MULTISPECIES: hypothetical protein [Faecalicatena]MBU3876017.1 hypothetical protein [Faecalicatena faecalis]MCI6468248.1 hypothetical protein [Faecalicatena sp.]MDY5620502.1 hypothetical protein [Lachnospiraceae bacterium]